MARTLLDQGSPPRPICARAGRATASLTPPRLRPVGGALICRRRLAPRGLSRCLSRCRPLRPPRRPLRLRPPRFPLRFPPPRCPLRRRPLRRVHRAPRGQHVPSVRALEPTTSDTKARAVAFRLPPVLSAAAIRLGKRNHSVLLPAARNHSVRLPTCHHSFVVISDMCTVDGVPSSHG